MVRAKGSKRATRRGRSNSYAPSSNGSSKMSTRPSSPRGRRGDSMDSLYSRDSSYESLRRPSKYSEDMSRHRPRHYGRMVCEAVARLKSRKGSSIRDIAKTLERKYPNTLKAGSNTTEKVIATARKLVRAGKLKKDGSNYFLIKTSSRKSRGFDDAGSSVRSHHMHGQEKRHSGGDRRSYNSSHRGRSDSRGRPPRNSSRSRSSGGPQRTRSHSRSRSRSRSRKAVRRNTSKKQKRGRPRNASGRKSLKRARGSKRKKKGARKGHTRLATGRRGPHQRKPTRARRRVKHTYTRRPKSDKLPEGESQNKGWFGGWFGGRGGGDAKQPGSDKGNDKGKKPEKRSKSTQERPIAGGGPEPGAV